MKIRMIDYGYRNKPFRAHYNDAGADVHVCLKDDKYKNKYKMRIFPHETVRVPLGFGIELPDGFMACVFPRSGLSSRGISCELPPIDSGYKGEIHAIVTNHTNKDVWLEDGERIGQLVVVPIIMADFVTPEEICDERGAGAFGSTGK